MNPSTLAAIVVGIITGTSLTQIDLNGIVDYTTPRIEGAIRWQEATVTAREHFADTPEERERAKETREQWEQSKALAESRLADFQNLKK